MYVFFHIYSPLFVLHVLKTQNHKKKKKGIVSLHSNSTIDPSKCHYPPHTAWSAPSDSSDMQQ